MSKRLFAFLVLYALSLLLAWVIPQVGVWGFLFESNYHPPYKWWGRPAMQLGERWSFYIGAVMILAVAIHWGRFPEAKVFSHPQSILLLLFTANSFVVTLCAFDYDASYKQMVDNLKWMLVFICIVKTHSDRRWLPMIILIYLLAIVDGGWDTTFHPKSGRFARGGPVTATFDENFVAGHAIALLPFAVMYAVSPAAKPWLRVTSVVGIPLLLNIVAHGQSRGGFLALLAAGVALPVVSKGRFRLIAIIALGFGALICVRLFHEQFLNRIASIEEYHSDGSAEGRIEAWKDAWDLSIRNPFGYGGEAFDRGLKRQSKSTHNMYFECLVAWGFQGTLLWLAFLGVTFRDCWKLSRRLYWRGQWPQPHEYLEAVALMVGLVSMLVTAVFLNRMRWELWWVYAAYVVCLKNICDSGNRTPRTLDLVGSRDVFVATGRQYVVMHEMNGIGEGRPVRSRGGA